MAGFGVFSGLLLGLAFLIFSNVPVPGRFASHGASTHAESGMTRRCLLLEYPDRVAERWFPYAVELSLEPSHFSSDEVTVYRALGWRPDLSPPPGTHWPSEGPFASYVVWAYAGRDSIDIEWHHSPVLRLPIRGDVVVGRGGYRSHQSLFDAVLTEDFVVRATRISCTDLPRGRT